MTTLTRAALTNDLLAGTFAGTISGSLLPRRIGVEVEFIPVESLTGRRCPIDEEGVTSTLPFLRRFGSKQGWQEGCTPKGTPCFSLPVGGTITFEPGGQLEYSSPPCSSASYLLALLRGVVLPLRAAAASEGVELLAFGIDPLNSIEWAPLLIQAKRYERMAAYLATRGPAGARMMRQTASCQVSLDFDAEPWLRWRVLNAASPYVTAIFANSPVYAREQTGYQSARAAVWREVDPTRTGIPYDERRPVEVYLEFALAAPAILIPTLDGEYRPFGDWINVANPTIEEWHDHLSTLFPEVRPRGHLELRSADTIAPHWYAAPLALLAGILYDPGALRAADDLLGVPDVTLLDRSPRWGMHDPLIARTAVDLCEIALSGCRGLGPSYFHPADLEQAAAFFDRYTRQGRAPADDVLENAIAA
jgi:glutamate--cysteine ligase